MTMGKTLKIVSLFIFSVSIVLGGVHDADAKKKKKKFEITEAEHALLDKWETKKNEKSRKKSVKRVKKSTEEEGDICGSCQMQWKLSQLGRY